ncbi:MAG: hypothetical protein WC249_00835 [Patescibacteria group bacterium]|jgi:hypothetical protein
MKKLINWPKITNNLNDYLLFLVALTAIWGAVVYYLYALNWLGIILSLVLIIGSFIAFLHFFKKGGAVEEKIIKNEIQTLNHLSLLSQKNKILLTAYGLFCLFIVIQLFFSQSDRAIVSPWQIINPSFFGFYSLASLLLVLILIKQNFSDNLKIILVSLHYLISLSIAVIVYKIGYGFDPFIHQATMKLISAEGLVPPKTPYYLGEYGLIVIVHQISGISINFLNKIIVPGLTALFLPTAFFRFLKKENINAPLTVLFLLILTFSPFILTTPQNLSYLFLILTVLASFTYSRLIIVWVLALATAAVHPLTGLPALTFVIWLTFEKYQKKVKLTLQKMIRSIIFISMSVALPLALLLAGGGQWPKINNYLNLLLSPLKTLLANPGMVGQEDWLSNFIYFLANNYNLFLIITIGVVLFFYYRQPKNDSPQDKILKRSLILISLALLFSYLLSSQIVFNNLVAYEQADYANRLPIIISIFLLPFLMAGLNQIIIKIRQQKNLIQIIWLFLGISLLSISLYLSYPRWDKYYNSRGYSVSADDLAAVKLINQNSPNPYIVLANQQVSAAALQELGFNHYYQTSLGPVYFYPIPTGGPLYQYYLNMVYKSPSQENMIGALNLSGTDSGYLIINKYWYQSDRIINEAKVMASKWWAINDRVYVFEYRR